MVTVGRLAAMASSCWQARVCGCGGCRCGCGGDLVRWRAWEVGGDEQVNGYGPSCGATYHCLACSSPALATSCPILLHALYPPGSRAAPMCPLHAGGVSGRTCTAYPACGHEVKAHGGNMKEVGGWVGGWVLLGS